MITKKIIDEHHGEIDVESKQGIGSTFLVRIPASPKPN
jgi:signal transduction histidine kinase